MSSFGHSNHVDAGIPDVPPMRMRTVLVDDSPDFLRIMLAIVDDFDVIDVVGLAGDGANAVAVVEDLHPDLVIMDVNMPSMNGFCAAATILARSLTTQVILMSAEEESTEFLELTEACGAVALVRKSAIREELGPALSKCGFARSEVEERT